MSMTNPIQLEFAFMRDDERRALSARLITSLDFPEYEFHRKPDRPAGRVKWLLIGWSGRG